MSEVIAFLEGTVYWYWLALGLGLMIIEVIVPGVLFLWLGIAALATGLILLAIPTMSWEIQFVVFAVLSVVSIFAGRRFVSARQEPTDHPTLNRRGENFVGQMFTLVDDTDGGRGRLQIGDSVWAVSVQPQGAEILSGARVKVVRVDGATLVVEAAPEV